MLSKCNLLSYLDAHVNSMRVGLDGSFGNVDLNNRDDIDKSMALAAHLVFVGEVYERLKWIVNECGDEENGVANCMRYLTQLRRIIEDGQLNQNMSAARDAVEDLMDGMADIIDPQGIMPA